MNKRPTKFCPLPLALTLYISGPPAGSLEADVQREFEEQDAYEESTAVKGRKRRQNWAGKSRNIMKTRQSLSHLEKALDRA